jgi:hypothetical protein
MIPPGLSASIEHRPLLARERTPGDKRRSDVSPPASAPDLEHLKKQAKDLLEDLQRQNRGSKLADALHAIAREYGFTSWPKLKAHVESLPRQEIPFVGHWRADLSIEAASGQPVSTRDASVRCGWRHRDDR